MCVDCLCIACPTNSRMSVSRVAANISAYASIELNLDVRNEKFVTGVEQTLETIIRKDCFVISKEKHIQTKNIFRQFIRWGSYQIIRIVFYLLTFYYKQRS